MRRYRSVLIAAATLALVASTAAATQVSAQQGFDRVSGEGSSWAAIAIDNMRKDVEKYGLTVDYAATGSSAGRTAWLNGTVDFAASDIPFQLVPEDGSIPEKPQEGSYAYIPVTAGGTAFMYNLQINGERVTNLRLSGENIARIFTGQATVWNDEAIQADNPGITLPPRPIQPVVRGDGSGSTAQFTAWMRARHGGIWGAYTSSKGLPDGATSYYPTVQGMLAANGDIGVAQAVQAAFAEGAIGYVNYSYALNASFPVVKVLNAAGFYTEPTPQNVAVSLLRARINDDNPNDLANYLTQDLSQVYTSDDPRNYELSSYSYFILRTTETGSFTESKGRSVARFAEFAMCEAQQSSASLGYSPIPFPLVSQSFAQIRRIPGAEVANLSEAEIFQQCNNPTFAEGGQRNLLAEQAPMPQPCDERGQYQCATGTGGLPNQPTTTRNSEVPQAGGGDAGGGGQATGGDAGGGGQPAGGGGSTDGGQSSGGGGATAGGGDATGGGAVNSGSSGGSTGGSTSSGGSTGGSTSSGGSTGGSGGSTGGSTGSSGGSSGTAGSGSTGGGATGSTGGTGSSTADDDDDAPDGGAIFLDDGSGTANGGDDGAFVDQGTVDPGADDAVSGGQTASPAAAVTPSPIVSSVLDPETSWSDQLGLIVLVLALLAGLTVGPVFLWRKYTGEAPA